MPPTPKKTGFVSDLCLPACLPACMHACMPACLPACLSVCLSIYLEFVGRPNQRSTKMRIQRNK